MPRFALLRSRRALMIVGGMLLALLIVVRLGVAAARSSGVTSETSGSIEVPPAVLAAHGLVQPLARANVATLGGGTIAELSVDVGQQVEKGQVVARLNGPAQVELVVAPLRGIVTALPVHAGDTLTPGAQLMTIADPSRYRVETTDVDEFLIGRLRTSQGASVTFDALPNRSIRGMVVSISPQAVTIASGGAHYPTIIDLPGAAPELRPGMTAHVTFDQ
jgi:multidrug efflux pump subunit AcrA (membrane-fusion protein)